MSYMALYRKWRPDTFEEVKGQDHVVTTLKNQIKNDRIGHAFLFCGTRGTGKTSIAKLFAKAVNCEHPVDGSPCNECASCKAIARSASMNVIEIDAASNNGVDNIRQIREEVQYPPTEGRYKVYIIDEVHMLSAGAFNALLKTLEEPPSYVIFILATTESHKIPITISSRCQKYDFRRISVETISDRLMTLLGRENVEAEKRAVDYIAKAADGSMRDALSILDQCIAFNLGQKLTYDMVLETIGAVDIDIFDKLFCMVIDLNVAGAIDVIDEVVWQGSELSRFVSEFTWFLRNILLVKVSDDADGKLDMTAEKLQRIKELSGMIDTETLIRYINVFSDTAASIKYAAQKRVVLELAVIKLCKPEMETDYESLLDRIRVLEKKLEQGVPGGMLSDDMIKQLMSQMVENGMLQLGGQSEPHNNGNNEETGAVLANKLKNNLPEADYNELMEFIEQWDIIASGYQHITRSYLDKASINLDGDGKGLLLTFVDEPENKRAIEYFKNKEKMAVLKNHIEETTGRKCNIALRVISNDIEAKREADENNLLKINFKVDYK
ncbi:MAG: DNA polymerase III subunit gamma/tau [Coprococcus sp.]